MPSLSDITTTPLSGLNYIDALLDKGPDWNFFTPAPGAPANTLYYTFSVTSGNEDSQSTASIFTGSPQAFSAFQQTQTRAAFAYLSQVTGIQFVETTAGTDAQIHLADVNLTGATTTGLCSWHSSYGYNGSQLVSYDADAYVYLDNVEWGAQNSNLTAGSWGYETLLHELGHALGLKHSFETTSDNSATLPAAQDTTANTLMSYNYTNTPYSQYQQDDLAALYWLYGHDGLGSKLGINSATGGRYLLGSSSNDTLVGTTADDTFQGNGGDDMINGGGGNDTAVFRAARGNYNINVLSDGDLQVVSNDGSDGTDTLHSINTLQFADMSVTRQAVLAASSGAPVAPTLNLSKDPGGYVTGNAPAMTGKANAGDTIKVYTADNTLVGSTTADSSGFFSITLNPFKDGTNYQIYATATNGVGVSSAASQYISFNVDAHMPSLAVTKNTHDYATGNTPLVNGMGAPGDTIHIYTSDGMLVGTALADSKTGVFSVVLSSFNDGPGYQIYATGTNGSVTSAHSQPVTFNIDAHPPTQPTGAVNVESSGNQVTFSGTGEPGTLIDLIRAGATTADFVEIAQAQVNPDGSWKVKTSPLINGDYTVKVVGVDLADNVTSASGALTFSINHPGSMVGTANNDTLRLTNTSTGIAIDGGAGLDTLVVNGSRADYTLTKDTWGVALVNNVTGVHDTLLNVERVQFNDNSVALDANGVGGELFRLYQAAFDRAAEPEGLGFWIWRMDNGSSLLQVAHEFMTNQPEFDALYGTNSSDMDFINHLYANVLHRAPDAGGFNYWVNALHNNEDARAAILVEFSESAENKATLVGTVNNGVTYTPHHT